MSQQESQQKRKMSTYGKAQVLPAGRQIVKSECGPLWLGGERDDPNKMLKITYVDVEMICNCKAFKYGMTDLCKHILSVAPIEVA